MQREEAGIILLCAGFIFLGVGLVYGVTGVNRSNSAFNDLQSLRPIISQNGIETYNHMVTTYQWAWLESTKIGFILTAVGVVLLVLAFALNTTLKEPSA